jgi:signal transduction protein with GAF and PtsI domain
MMDVNDSRVWPQAHFGEGPSYLEFIETMLVTDLTEAQGLVRTAIRENQPIWLQDIQRDSSMATFRDWAQAHGWHSNAVLPLTTRGMPVGVLSVYSKTVGGFAAIAQKLLTQLASNISYALDFFNMMLSGVWRRSLWRRVKFVTAPCLPTIACQ